MGSGCRFFRRIRAPRRPSCQGASHFRIGSIRIIHGGAEKALRLDGRQKDGRGYFPEIFAVVSRAPLDESRMSHGCDEAAGMCYLRVVIFVLVAPRVVRATRSGSSAIIVA